MILFDDLLSGVFDDHLANYLPHRVLPLSSEPPRDFQLHVDDEFEAIRKLLGPGKRRPHEARARIRTLLTMEAHAVEDVKVWKKFHRSAAELAEAFSLTGPRRSRCVER